MQSRNRRLIRHLGATCEQLALTTGRALATAILLAALAGCGSKKAVVIPDPAATDPSETATEQGEGDSGTKTTPTTSPVAPPILLRAPEFMLTDQSGNSFGTKDLSGRV